VAVPWVTRSVSRRGFDIRAVDNPSAPRQASLRVFRVSPVSVIPPVLHSHLRLEDFVTRRKNGQSLGAFQKAKLLEVGESWIEKYFQFLVFIFYRVGKCAVRMNSLEMKTFTASLRIAVYEACMPPPKHFVTRSILTWELIFENNCNKTQY